ncbi:MAG: class I tRNA ligase family protein [Patescibacteria group bacterium]
MKEEEKNKSEVAQKEESILNFWSENKIFDKTLQKESPKGEFVFFEGPPTANAKPALHHLEARAFKDIIPRYKTMQGFSVRRKAGWDTHGLPVELQIEKKLGLTSKKDIEQYGVEKFNRECKESVFQYISDWEKFTDRIGYWVNKEEAYYTFENNYIESVWNILKTVDDKGLLYKDYKVLPWCPRCGTALSSHELAQGYQDDKDLSVTAKFKIKGFENAYFLAWTTTPWTLPGNVALAVGPDIVYVEAKVGNEILVLAKERLSVITEPYEIVAEHKGSECVGMEYEPLYPYFAEKFTEKNPEAFAKSYKVYSADFVTTTDGTGIVHTAVMYGQEDFVLGTQIGLPKFHLVKEDGHFLDEMGFLSNRFVKDEEVAIDIIKDLAGRGQLFKKEKYEHSYPHCWRCKTALIYYARDSWYIKMSSLRDELVKENEAVNWEPEHIKEGRFGEWLREIKDWAISRERYWGTPMPIWEKQNGDKLVVSSIADLKKYVKKSGNNYFVMRHGESVGNINGVWSCNVENHDPLTDKGVALAKANAEYLKDKNIDLIIASPFERTMQTAKTVAGVIGISPESVIVDDSIVEWNAGKEWNGKPIEDYFVARNSSPDRYAWRAEGGESYDDVLKRVGEFLYKLEKQYSGKNILIVSHGGLTRAMSLVADGYTRAKLFTSTRSFRNYENAEIRKVDFVPLPYNSDFELDLHKPYIDEVQLVDEDGTPMKRVKEVMDVWFDSGAMPFAQDHYPFQGDVNYPADFISEAIDQTRGWFYTLHAIGVLLGKGKAYKNVICLGHILDKEGKKMSKSVGNILDPWDLMNKYGVDALRFWMYSVNNPGDSKNFDEKTVDEITKKVFNPIVNILAFYNMYNDGSIKPNNESSDVLDRWIISRLNELVEGGTKNLDAFKVFDSARSVRDFVNDFSTWYVRRSRDRFKSDNLQEKTDALSTTGFVLQELMKYMAPFTPFFAEEIYLKVRKDGDDESVHLCSWPKAGAIDSALVEEMESVRGVVTAALELRQKSGHKVRQPLQSLVVNKNFNQELLDIIADEVNVKTVSVGESLQLDTDLTDDLRKEGVARDIVRGIQDLRKKENLSPSDSVTLVLCVDENTKAVIEEYKNMITTPTGVGAIEYSNDKQVNEVSLENGSLSLMIKF